MKSTYYGMVIVDLILQQPHWVGYHIAHYTDEKTELQRSYLP